MLRGADLGGEWRRVAARSGDTAQKRGVGGEARAKGVGGGVPRLTLTRVSHFKLGGSLGAPGDSLGIPGDPWGSLGIPWGSLGIPGGSLGNPWGGQFKKPKL